MAVDFESAISAYRQAASSIESTMENKPVVVPAPGEHSFTNMVTDSLKSAAEVGYQAEELTLKKISGEADLKDVVTAVANAEQTLETVVAVRDKVLSAYQEILKMPI